MYVLTHLSMYIFIHIYVDHKCIVAKKCVLHAFSLLLLSALFFTQTMSALSNFEQ